MDNVEEKGELVVEPAPVGCVGNVEKGEFVCVGLVALLAPKGVCDTAMGKPETPLVRPTPLGLLLKAKDDATPDISVAPGLRALGANEEVSTIGSFWAGRACSWPAGGSVACAPLFMANSISVSALGTGGGVLMTGPNGFLDPV